MPRFQVEIHAFLQDALRCHCALWSRSLRTCPDNASNALLGFSILAAKFDPIAAKLKVVAQQVAAFHQMSIFASHVALSLLG